MIDLEALFKEINDQCFSGELSDVFLRWNSRLRSCAGRFIPGRRRSLFFYESRPTIEIATYLKDLAHVRDTLGHEMIHLWLWQQKKPYGHTQAFKKKMKAMGVSRYNSFPKSKNPKVVYHCVNCGGKYPAMRRRKNLACKACCQKHARGQYDSRFRLRIMDWDGNTL